MSLHAAGAVRDSPPQTKKRRYCSDDCKAKKANADYYARHKNDAKEADQ